MQKIFTPFLPFSPSQKLEKPITIAKRSCGDHLRIMHRIFLLLILLLSSCTPLYMPPPPPMNEKALAVDPNAFSEVIIPFATELKHTRRLRFEDSCVYWDDSVERIRVIFSSQDILEICELRDLMVTVVEGLLERFNASGSIAANFNHFPITAKDLELYFSFEAFYIEYDDPSYIAWMSLHDGLVRYYSGVLKDPRKDFWETRIEPYYKTYEFNLLQKSSEESWYKAHPRKKNQSYELSLD